MKETFNAQRSTSNFEIVIADWWGAQAASLCSPVKGALHRLLNRRFVNRTDDYARHDHLDEAADAYQYEELCGKWLRRVNHATRADCQNLQHDSEANTGPDSATGETASVNHDKRERQACITDNDPLKQAHYLFARPKKSLRLSENIFQNHTVIEPSPKEDEDERGNEGEEEFSPIHDFFSLSPSKTGRLDCKTASQCRS